MRKGQVEFSRYKVVVLEYERGYGSKVDEVIYFDTEANAKAFQREFNSLNTSNTVPDWYMIAEYNYIKD